MARKGGLGKGLAALIPGGVSGVVLEQIPVNSIRPNPRQPRQHFDEDSLNDLAASIKEIGLLQPVLVRQTDTGYELVAGERRWRAARRAGLEVVPAVVRDVSEGETLEQALVENLHRQDLNPLEEAAAYQQLIEDFGLTHDEVATRVGKSRSAISNTLRLIQLAPNIQKLVADNSLSAGHARALLGTEDRAFQEGLARRAVREGMSVRAVEEAVRLREEAESVPAARKPTEAKSADFLEAEAMLGAHLGTRVKIASRSVKARGRGRIVIEFAGRDDLTRICNLILAGHDADSPPEAVPEEAAESA